MTAFVALLICISGYVPEDDASAFARAAQRRGYDVQTGSGPECATTLVRSDSDWTTATMLGYDDGELDGAAHKPLTVDRAVDLITAWEARL